MGSQRCCLVCPMRKASLAQVTSLLATDCLSAAQRSTAEARQATVEVLQDSNVIDPHANTPQMTLDEVYNLADLPNPYMISTPEMCNGRLGGNGLRVVRETVQVPKQMQTGGNAQ